MFSSILNSTFPFDLIVAKESLLIFKVAFVFVSSKYLIVETSSNSISSSKPMYLAVALILLSTLSIFTNVFLSKFDFPIAFVNSKSIVPFLFTRWVWV